MITRMKRAKSDEQGGGRRGTTSEGMLETEQAKRGHAVGQSQPHWEREHRRSAASWTQQSANAARGWQNRLKWAQSYQKQWLKSRVVAINLNHLAGFLCWCRVLAEAMIGSATASTAIQAMATIVVAVAGQRLLTETRSGRATMRWRWGGHGMTATTSNECVPMLPCTSLANP